MRFSKRSSTKIWKDLKLGGLDKESRTIHLSYVAVEREMHARLAVCGQFWSDGVDGNGGCNISRIIKPLSTMLLTWKEISRNISEMLTVLSMLRKQICTNTFGK